MIVKVQLPLATNEAVPKMLVYTENRRFEMMMPITERMQTELREYPHKGYFRLTFDMAIGDWCFGERVDAQEW